MSRKPVVDSRSAVQHAPLRILQVGLGGWGSSWAFELSKRPDLVTQVGFVDLSAEVLARLQASSGVGAALCFSSLSDALAATDAEAVLVTTAMPGHAPVALEALRAGKHVLVEKPIAGTLGDARGMVDAAAVADRVFMVSQNYRFFPAPRAVAALIAEGRLGDVGAVEVSFRKYANTAPVGENRHYALPDPLLMDMSIHHFDLMRFVLGQEPVRIDCHAWNPSWSRFVEPAAAVAAIRFDGGAVVSYRGSWVSTQAPTLWAGRWAIECARGTIEWTSRADEDTASDEALIRHLDGREEVVPLAPMEDFDRFGSVAEFQAAIRENRAPSPSGQENLATLALTLAAIESSQTGSGVEILRSDEPRIASQASPTRT
jgi:predicted dehydrogenase